MQKVNIKNYISPYPHGLMFHRFHGQGDRPTGQGSLTPADLENMLEFVGIKNILSPQEWLSKLNNNTLENRHVCLTLDDGLKSQYDFCLPVLERYGLKAFWFVISLVIEGGMNKNEIYNYFGTQYFSSFDEFFEEFFSRCPDEVLEQLAHNAFKDYAQQASVQWPFYTVNDLKFRFIRNELLSGIDLECIIDGMIIDHGLDVKEIAKNLWLNKDLLKSLSDKGQCVGLHSYDHPLAIAKLNRAEQKRQYQQNFDHIKSITGQEPASMSHPVNSYNKDTLVILKELGVRCGFRSNMLAPEGKAINPNGLELAREDAVNIYKLMSGDIDEI